MSTNTEFDILLKAVTDWEVTHQVYSDAINSEFTGSNYEAETRKNHETATQVLREAYYRIRQNHPLPTPAELAAQEEADVFKRMRLDFMNRNGYDPLKGP